MTTANDREALSGPIIRSRILCVIAHGLAFMLAYGATLGLPLLLALVFREYAFGLAREGDRQLLGWQGVVIGCACVTSAISLWDGLVAFGYLASEESFGVGRVCSNRQVRELVKSVASTLGVHPFARIYVAKCANAFTTVVRGESVLVLGVPLIRFLSKSELSAVIAHEYGHQQNASLKVLCVHEKCAAAGTAFGDIVRRRLRSSARGRGFGFWGMLKIIVLGMRFIQVLVVVIYEACARGIAALVMNPHEEFLCDDIAARAYGSGRMQTALLKISDLQPALELAIAQANARTSVTRGAGHVLLSDVGYFFAARRDRSVPAERAHDATSGTHPPLNSRLERMRQASLPDLDDDGSYLLQMRDVEAMWSLFRF
jgi:Zn-dependent protease with chaperone function